MPRRGKKGKNKGPSLNGRERHQLAAKTWTRLIRRALDLKQDYTDKAKEVEAYLKSDHSTLYEDPNTQHYWMSYQGSAAISIPKVAQVRNSLGPRLYPAKPNRKVVPTGTDGVMLGLARTVETYLNYSAREGKFVRQMRKTIDDGMIRGRCVLQQISDPIRNIVTSIHLSSLDFVYDPDFDDLEDAKWIAYRVREPFWETERRIDKAQHWRLKGLKEKLAERQDGDDQEKPSDKEAETAPLLTYWVILSKMGWGGRACGNKETDRYEDKEDFVRLEVVLDHDVPISEGEWEVPLYLDRDWPISMRDYIESVDGGWPDSIFGQVLSAQKGIDLLTSLKMTSCKNRERLVIFADARLDKLNQDTLRNGTAADFVSVDLPNGVSLDRAIHVADFGQGNPETSMERQFLIQQMEVTTGVTDILHGGEDPSAAKDRSATATQVRGEAAKTRVKDLIQRTQELHEDAARKEAIIVRLTVSLEDMSRIVKADDINLFYVKVTVPGGATVPVRDTRPEEERKSDDGPLTLERLSPNASTYFLTPQDAANAMVYLWQDMQMSVDPRVAELTRILGSEIAPEDGLPVGLDVDVVTPERVWIDTAGMSAEELMRELSYEIAAGQGIKQNQEAEQANADYLIQTALPVAMQAGDIGTVNKIMKIRDDAFEIPETDRVQFAPPPPPEPASPPGEGGEKKEGPPK